MTQIELATAALTGVSTIRSIERGKGERPPKVSTTRQIETALGWAGGSIDSLLAGGDATMQPPERTGTSIEDLRIQIDQLTTLIGRSERYDHRRETVSSQSWETLLILAGKEQRTASDVLDDALVLYANVTAKE